MNRNNIKGTSGFTLIELVCVIVLLGILSAAAAPKFMNLQRDARIASLKGTAAAIKSAVNIAGSRSYIAGNSACYVYDSKSRSDGRFSVLRYAAQLKCGKKDTLGNPHLAETLFGIPTSRGQGIIYALAGMSADTEKKEYGNINQDTKNYKKGGTVKCSDLSDTDFCFLWINATLNGEDGNSGVGKILIGNKSSFVKINNPGSFNTDKYDASGSCILEYTVTAYDANGNKVLSGQAANAVSASYKVNFITDGC